MFQSIISHQSKAFPGCSFTVRALSEGRRIKLSLELADVYDEIEELRRKHLALQDDVRPVMTAIRNLPESEQAGAVVKAIRENDSVAKAIKLQREIDGLEANKLNPAYVRVLLAGIEFPPDTRNADWLIEDGPRELYAEVLSAVKRELGLTDDETGNSESPTTSPAPAVGEIQTTSAELAYAEATV